MAATPSGAARSARVFVLPAALRARLEAFARAAYPEEGCGSILGVVEGALTIAREVSRGRNIERERPRERYLLDPADQLADEERARAAGLEVVGYWHSHPDHPAAPSRTDRDRAARGVSYLILSVRAGAIGDLRAFRMDEGDLAELELVGE